MKKIYIKPAVWQSIIIKEAEDIAQKFDKRNATNKFISELEMSFANVQRNVFIYKRRAGVLSAKS